MAQITEEFDLTHLSNLRVIRLWILRVLIKLGGHQRFIRDSCFDNETLAKKLGFGEVWFNQPTFDKMEALVAIRRMLDIYERVDAKKSFALPKTLLTNIAGLATLMNLSEDEQKILAFVILLNAEQLLDDTCDYLGGLTAQKTEQVLSTILNIPFRKVRTALSSQSQLSKSGLLSVDRNSTYHLRLKLDLLFEGLVDNLLCNEEPVTELLRESIHAMPAPELDESNYAYLEPAISDLKAYLKECYAQKKVGINIFVYGPAGTGKTQLPRVIANSLGLPAFEIACENLNGQPISALERLRAYRSAQAIFRQRPTLLVFDEVEDVFNDTSEKNINSTAQNHKAWMNHLLENNEVPSIWVSNRSDLDPAFIRRFDYVVNLKIPPRQVRSQIIDSLCGDKISELTRLRLLELEKLSPAIMSRVVKVANTILDSGHEVNYSETLERLVHNTLRAQGHSVTKKSMIAEHKLGYDINLIHTTANLTHLVAGLKQSPQARLCFYGEPGTGKSLFGRYLADELGLPLMIKKASDMVSPYVGETEQNMAQAFTDASLENAVLLIDEVDTFLMSRTQANHSWESSAVNEMLLQLESFDGVFIATTNRLDQLDSASLRRFDFKLEFKAMTLTQRVKAFSQLCEQLALPMIDIKQVEHALQPFTTLSLGDLAVIRRQTRFELNLSVERLLEMIATEMKIKPSQKTSNIGFV